MFIHQSLNHSRHVVGFALFGASVVTVVVGLMVGGVVVGGVVVGGVVGAGWSLNLT